MYFLFGLIDSTVYSVTECAHFMSLVQVCYNHIVFAYNFLLMATHASDVGYYIVNHYTPRERLLFATLC